MIPMAGFIAMKPAKTDPVLLHQQVSSNQEQSKFETILALTSDQDIRDAAYAENLAEDMRLLYVAITRARFHCYLGMPVAKSTSKTALAGVLGLSDTYDPEEMLAHLTTLPSTLFEVTHITQAGQTQYNDHYSTSNLSSPPAKPDITDRWRVHSYTGLSRLIQTKAEEPAVTVIEPGFADDDAGPTDNLTPGLQKRTPQERMLSRFTFPRGPRVGVALHDMLENLRFDAPAGERQAASQRLIDRVVTGEKEDWLATTTQWVTDMLSTPMKQAPSFALKDIPATSRLNELEFHFPVTVTNDFLHTLQDAGYLDPNATLSVSTLNGMMTGFIDLVVLHDNKYYLVDYKSNDLGPEQTDYADPNLGQAIRHHQYDLQYLIYCVALNRYLKQCQPQYNYADDFGGVCYLFLRGMSGKPGDGIFFDLPDQKLIERLDQLLSPTALSGSSI
jgi:exodeoxyribonuclease V beta subunit